MSESITNSIGMELVLVPAGSFVMGGDPVAEQADENETPRHKVTFTKPFFVGKVAVMQSQWQKLMGNNPSRFIGDERPVEMVSFKDVLSSCAKGTIICLTFLGCLWIILGPVFYLKGKEDIAKEEREIQKMQLLKDVPKDLTACEKALVKAKQKYQELQTVLEKTQKLETRIKQKMKEVNAAFKKLKQQEKDGRIIRVCIVTEK